MKLLKLNKNKLIASLCFGLIFSVLLSFAKFDTLCEDLRDNVLRLHILANSDSDADQQLKLKVRDEVIKNCSYVFEGKTTIDEAYAAAEQNLPLFKNVAQKTVNNNGYAYDVNVSLSNSYFNTRVYDDFTLPAGVYESIKIEIGKAEGKNWWCVMFPSVCLYSAADKESVTNENKLEYSASKQSAYVAEHSEEYVVKFKVIEVYEKIKKYFSKS